jgi:VWFA-related protein
MTRRVASSLVLAVAVLAAPALLGQTPAPAPQQPTFRARVDSVSVDVQVTDKTGKPVDDLTADDFEIKESKQVQTIDTFKLIKIDENPDAAPPREILSLEAQAREAARDDTRLIVIFLDDYHTRRGNSMRVKGQISRWVSTLNDHDLVAVAYPLTPPGVLTFTYNHDGIAAAIDKFEGRKYDYTPRNAYEERYQMSPPEIQERMRNDLVVAALRTMCTYLGTMRDGRKTILYVSEGMAGTIPAGISTTGSSAPVSGTTVGTSREQSFSGSASLLGDLVDVFRTAARNNTSIYTLDPRGLAGSEFDINDSVASQMDRAVLNESIDTLRTIASNTNGRAIVNRNDPGPELRQMIRDSSAYYLLGYTSTLAARDGKFHEIQVRVKRKDVEVRARKGYWAYTEEEVAKATAAPKPAPARDVQEALDGLATAVAPSERHPVRVWMGTKRGGESGKSAVTFSWEAATDAVSDPASGIDHVAILVTSETGDKVFEGAVAHDPAAAPRNAGTVTFDAPPGRVRVHMSAETAKNVRVDADDRNFEVPDYTTPGVVVTEPVVFRARTARDIQLLRAAAAPIPTAARVFSRTERLLVRFQAFGPAGATPTVTMRLLNTQGDSMAALPAPTVTPAGYESDLGLAPLPPGDYLIEISAQVGGEQIRKLLAVRVTT